MEAIIFKPFSFASKSSCLICSEANTPPPPESTLSTIALTFSSSCASLISLEVESPPIVPGGCTPSTMVPFATMTAILSIPCWSIFSERIS